MAFRYNHKLNGSFQIAKIFIDPSTQTASCINNLTFTSALNLDQAFTIWERFPNVLFMIDNLNKFIIGYSIEKGTRIHFASTEKTAGKIEIKRKEGFLYKLTGKFE